MKQDELRQVERSEDAVSKMLAKLRRSAEIMALEYLAHGNIDVTQLEIIDGASQVLDHQSAILAAAEEFEALVKRLRRLALNDRPMESENELIGRMNRERVALAVRAEEIAKALDVGDDQ